MTPCTLFFIPVDRCAAHGVWFDHGELESALFEAAPAKPEEELDGVGITGGLVEGLGDLLLEILLPWD